MHVITNEAHRAGRKDGDRLGLEIVVGFLDGLFELLFTAENNLLILHVRGKAIGHVILAVAAVGVRLIAACQPAVEPASDRSVGDVDDVPRRPQDDPFTAGIAAAALADEPGHGAHVGTDHRNVAFRRNLIDDDLLGAFAGHFGGVFRQHPGLDGFRVLAVPFDTFSRLVFSALSHGKLSYLNSRFASEKNDRGSAIVQGVFTPLARAHANGFRARHHIDHPVS